MAVISQTTFSNVFSSMEMFEIRLNSTEVCSYGSHQQYPSIGVDNGLVPSRRQAIICSNAGLLVYQNTHASLGLNE